VAACRSLTFQNNLEESSLEYKFIEKHKELLEESVKLSAKDVGESEDFKTECADENNGDEQNVISQSSSSLLKPQRK